MLPNHINLNGYDFPSVYTDIRPLTDFIEDHINQPGGTDEYIDENTLIDTGAEAICPP